MLEQLAISTLNGIIYGMLLFMLASGLTLIFGMMGVLNLAHASMYMLGAYLGYQISKTIGFLPALILGPLALGLGGALLERYGLRRVHQHGHVSELLFTFGVAFMIQEAVQMIWGRIGVPYRVPPELDFPLFRLFDTPYPAYRIFVLVLAVAIFVGLFAILSRSRIGLVIRAALTHPNMVGMLGHNVPQVFMLVFGVGAGLAGLAGVIGGPIFVTSPNMAGALGAILFTVVVIGGLGSLPGALLASLLIGLVQTFAVVMDVSLDDFIKAIGVDAKAGNILGDIQHTTIAQIAPILPYLMLLVMLVVRPRGLFGSRDV
ncbi:branched-chain amino acid ABC transporter permease [Reyranella sp.]|uniref:branched-chain amino acid ABC transporter permease n=1 Tax=Reyranella sp. TaxID=1929291 RepID=UPI0011FC5428|nr:branched-chain amino acid ABC transporter permease [Reyranella sp.]TAJ89939.1 MAG: branched-chain amino acid ABC transporter permease [Reyranella sp.]